MTTVQPSQERGTSGRIKHWLTRWWHGTPTLKQPPDLEHVPTVEQALEQDGPIRWRILLALHGFEWASLEGIEFFTHRVGAEERQRSLDWLLAIGCITAIRRRERAFFWQPWCERLVYSRTPIGAALFAAINETATAEQLGLPEASDPPRKRISLWLRVPLFVGIIALTLIVTGLVLVGIFSSR